MLILIVILLILSGFFAGAETALIGASHAKIYKLCMEGNLRAKMLSSLLKQKERLVGIILLCYNAVTIAASAVATSLAISYFGNNDLVLGIVTVVMTLLILIFAEVLPKTYALRHTESVALAVAPLFVVLVRVLLPISVAVQGIVNATLWIFGIRRKPVGERRDTDELRGAIALHHEQGDVVKDERDMLGSILDLEKIEVSEVMVHRKDMVTLDTDMPIQEIINQALGSPYTRLPVWQKNQDNIIGILHSKQLMQALHHAPDRSALQLKNVLIAPWFIPETTTLKDQLKAFREHHSHLAFVVDEYGALLGMVTLEDILEEIVGQIDDEHDARTHPILHHDDGSCTVDGTITVRDLNREFGWALPDDRATTVAGLIIHKVQQIPEAGQVFHIGDFKFEVLKRKRNQIASVRIRKFEAGEEARV